LIRERAEWVTARVTSLPYAKTTPTSGLLHRDSVSQTRPGQVPQLFDLCSVEKDRDDTPFLKAGFLGGLSSPMASNHGHLFGAYSPTPVPPLAVIGRHLGHASQPRVDLAVVGQVPATMAAPDRKAPESRWPTDPPIR